MQNSFRLTYKKILLFLLGSLSGCDNKSNIKSLGQKDVENKIKNGDIIFQTSKSNQSIAIQLATNSKYIHMRGLVVFFLLFYCIQKEILKEE